MTSKAKRRTVAGPPPVLTATQVLEYTPVGQATRRTGRPLLRVDGKELGRVAWLAIGRQLYGEQREYVLLYCSAAWRVLAITGEPTVAACRASAKAGFEGLGGRWVRTRVTRAKAVEWLRARSSGFICTMCDKLPEETKVGLVKGKRGSVCFTCIREMGQLLSEED